MILVVTLHCDGRDSHHCTAAVSTGIPRAPRGSSTLALILDALGRITATLASSGWTHRPIATRTGDQLCYYCPACTQRLLDLAATDTPPHNA